MTNKPSLSHLPDWPRMMNAPVAAEYLGVSENHLRAGATCGKFPAPLRDGKRVLWDRRALDKWADIKGGFLWEASR